MRQLFVICSILIQLLAFVSAEAKLPVSTVAGTEKESPLTISSSLQREYPADVSSVSHFTGPAFSQRYHRAVPAMARWYNEILPSPFFSDKHFDVYSSPLFLPLSRYLLYPNHYFW